MSESEGKALAKKNQLLFLETSAKAQSKEEIVQIFK